MFADSKRDVRPVTVNPVDLGARRKRFQWSRPAGPARAALVAGTDEAQRAGSVGQRFSVLQVREQDVVRAKRRIEFRQSKRGDVAIGGANAHRERHGGCAEFLLAEWRTHQREPITHPDAAVPMRLAVIERLDRDRGPPGEVFRAEFLAGLIVDDLEERLRRAETAGGKRENES